MTREQLQALPLSFMYIDNNLEMQEAPHAYCDE
jgi:hypothetical protein